MPEVGLLPFARVTLDVATTVLPPYRTRFSKHQFTQPQLLAVLCLMRYEDWTFREAEVRVREHGELRRVLGLRSVPDYPTVYRFLKRLDPKQIDPKRWERPHVGWVAALAIGVAVPAWPWMRPAWRRVRSARSSCGVCITTRRSRFPGGSG